MGTFSQAAGRGKGLGRGLGGRQLLPLQGGGSSGPWEKGSLGREAGGAAWLRGEGGGGGLKPNEGAELRERNYGGETMAARRKGTQ